MYSADGLGRKYAVGKMAEIMITCKQMIFKIQEDIYKASIDVVAMGEVPAVCTTSSTCFGNRLSKVPQKVPIDRRTSLPTPMEPENILDPRLRRLYQKVMDLEAVGRLEWLKAFMHMSSYMRVLRPLPRGDWDEPKKLIQRHTITLDGPYPGISNDLIVVDKKPVSVAGSAKIRRKSSTDCVLQPHTMKVKNMELKGLGDDHGDFLFTTRGPLPPSRRPSRNAQSVPCECLGIVQRSPTSSETRRKSSVEKTRPKYLKKYEYCVV